MGAACFESSESGQIEFLQGKTGRIFLSGDRVQVGPEGISMIYGAKRPLNGNSPVHFFNGAQSVRKDL